MHPSPATVQFGACEVDLRSGEVRRAGTVVRLQDKPLQLLTVLLERPGQLVTRDEIRERIWGASRYHDFEDSLNQAVRKLREAFADTAISPRFVETIPRRGYRFIAALQGQEPNAAKRTTVGRERELAEIRAEFELAASGRGRVVCVSGEPGIGKTTVVETALERLANSGACLIATGRCSERLAGTESYLPVIECLESLLRSDDAAAVRDSLEQVAPSWLVQLGLPPFGTLDSSYTSATQERRKREFVALVEVLASRRPLVFFIDDLHWADTSTVDLLSYAGSRAGSTAVLFLGAFRPSDLRLSRHSFLEVMLELQSHRLFREIEISLLGQGDVQRYVDLEYPGNDFPPTLASAIYERTEGSPLFVADLLRDLRSLNLIELQHETWTMVGTLPEIGSAVPDSVRGMVHRKLARLSSEHRRLLEIASVQGFAFDATVLSRVSGSDAAEVEESLDELQQQHRLVHFTREREFPDSTFTLEYAFSHALYQEALYQELRATRRAALSRDIAGALLELHRGEAVPVASQLASLYEIARDWTRAAECFTIAATSSARFSVTPEIVTLAARAVENARKISGPERDRRLLDAAACLAAARQALSQFEQSIADFELVDEAAARAGDNEARVNAMCGAAISAGYVKRMDEMRERGHEALRIASDSSLSPAFAQTVLGFERLFAGDLVSARSYLDEALPPLRQQGASQAAVFAAGSRGLLDQFQSEYSRAEELLRWSIGNVHGDATCPDLLRSSWVLGMAVANQGRISEAVKILSEGMRLAELNGAHYWYSRFPNTLGWILAEVMDFDSALALNSDGVRAGRECETPETEANSHINLANIHVKLGDLRSAWDHLAEGERILNHPPHKHWLRWRFNIRLSLEMANYWIARGSSETARDWAAQALSHAQAKLARKHEAAAHKILGDAEALDERFGAAVDEYRLALGVLSRHPCPIVEWRVLDAASRAAARAGDSSAARRFTDRSAAIVAALSDSIDNEKLRGHFIDSHVARRVA
jgi:DNA-binding winged helix-turn-helix (wHTH) protein/tetratricopeptide (TPR) repeat protein